MGGMTKKAFRWELFKKEEGLPWYYWVYDEDLKRHTFSTGCMRKAEAKEEVLERERNGTLIPCMKDRHKKDTRKTVRQYGKNFWNYESCPIIKSKIARGGHFSVKVASQNQQKFDDHICPYLGDVELAKLTANMIEQWLLDLPKKSRISNKTANDAFFVFRQMLDQAVFEEEIKSNPAKTIKPLVRKSTRKGAFTLEQIKALFEKPWKDKWAYTACYVASRTGMRIGEVRALTLGQVFPDHINVDASWADSEGRKSTKSGWERVVPINKDIYNLLMEIAPPFEDCLFFSLDGKSPVRDKYFNRRLVEKMDEINAEKGRLFFDYDNKKAPLSFHSFRHFLNTRLLAADLPNSKIQAIIGHESDKMTEHYAHLDVDDLKVVREVQFSLA